MRTNWMKTAVLLLGMSLSGTALLAQATAAPETTAQNATQRPQLSAEQKEQLGEMRANARDQAAIIRNDQSLTAEQKRAKLKALRASTREQMKSVLTPDQQKSFAARREARKSHMDAKLGLTADQKSKMKELRASTHQQRQAVLTNSALSNEQKQAQLAQIRQTSKAQLATILTPDQLAQLKQMRMGSRHHEHAQM
jgi:Spy/CpxP family protein refolding chaperone